MHAIRRYPMRTLNQGITSIREAAVEDFVSIRKFFAKSDSRTGHFMRTLGSQPLPMQTCPKQVRAQVSSHALPGRSHCFLLALHATDLRSPGYPTRCQNSSSEQSHRSSARLPADSMPIAPAPSMRFSPITFLDHRLGSDSFSPATATFGAAPLI